MANNQYEAGSALLPRTSDPKLSQNEGKPTDLHAAFSLQFCVIYRIFSLIYHKRVLK
jgi:hypothetical protein